MGGPRQPLSSTLVLVQSELGFIQFPLEDLEDFLELGGANALPDVESGNLIIGQFVAGFKCLLGGIHLLTLLLSLLSLAPSFFQGEGGVVLSTIFLGCAHSERKGCKMLSRVKEVSCRLSIYFCVRVTNLLCTIIDVSVYDLRHFIPLGGITTRL